MNLSYTDRITILSALSQKAQTINSWLKEDPNDEFWIDKLQDVKTAYKNFSDRELELEEFQEESTLVGSIDVLPPVSPAELVAQNPQEPDEIDGIGVEVAQGLSVVISESLTPQTQIAVDPWEDEREEPDGDEERLLVFQQNLKCKV